MMYGKRLLVGFLSVAVALLTFYFLVLGTVRTVGMLTLPYQAEYGEGPVLEWARQISNGTLPYKPIDTPPYNFSVYTPVYFALSGVLIPLFPDNPYFGGRLISLLSALALGGLIWDWRVARPRAIQNADEQQGRFFQKTPLLPLAVVILWLVSPYVFRWATFYRPDMLALFWSALGIFLVSHFSFPISHFAEKRERGNGKWETRTYLLAAALCFVLAFFTKQSFFAAPLAALGWLVVERRWRDAFWLAGSGAVLGGVGALVLYGWVGAPLIDNLIAANANPFSWEAVGRFWQSFVRIAPILMVVALVALRRRENLLWGIYLGLAVLVSLSIGKAGAWENYFLEPLWVMCVLAGRVARPRPTQSGAEGEERGGTGTYPPPILWLSVLLLAQLLLYTRGYERLSIPAERAWLDALRTEGAALRAAVNAVPPDVPIYSEQMGVVAEVGRPLLLHSFVYTQLGREGLWDETDVTARLASGEGVVIQQVNAVNDPLDRDRWSRAMLDAIERGYGLGTPTGEWLVRSAIPENRFHYPDTPQVVGDGFTLLNWEATSCAPAAPCETGVRPITLTPNGTLQIKSLWQSSRAIRAPLSLSVKLFDAEGGFVTQADGAFRHGWMGWGWAEGAILRDESRPLTLPPILQDGVYTVELTLYESETGVPLATTRLPYFKVQSTAPPLAPLPTDAPLFGNRVALVENSPIPPSIHSGETLDMGIMWQAAMWHPNALTTFLHLLDADGELVAQTDFAPPYPPHAWGVGELVTVSYRLTIPTDLPAGDYRLVAGWYDSATLVRLPLADGGGDTVTVGSVRVTGE